MKTFITSDLHFGHRNIMKFCPSNRGHFKDIDHMREEMIRLWNSIVGVDDLTYILGDVAFCSADEAAQIMRRLNGKKILIEGNHDRKLLNNQNFKDCFQEIHKYLWLNYNGTEVILFHYPIWEWDQMHRGSVHFHGHLHGNPNGMSKYRVKDVGYDATGQIVISMEEAIAGALKGEIRRHH